MKKFFSIIAIGAMTIGMSSFDSEEIYQEDCDVAYNELHDFAVNNGATDESAKAAAGNYWANCVNNGGSSAIMDALKFIGLR
ncbi:hypothetical protein [Psychroflexus halocasei]|uniref:Uncharacterized protein n=1 Tax=Psychroflexus halocasei TaxID=908615 RepID=A0A1H4ARZ8_9FLAO|nr:hypothetical protein [Psychroflexus halocasei]SEA38735.1 hypothetical protein SAMN05421540_105128 [Psychroflexus halocasei]